MKKHYTISSFVFIWLLKSLLTTAAPVLAAPTPPLDGLWKGPVKVPGGEWEVVFRVVPLAGGTYFASLDVPVQRVSHIEVTVELQGDSVRFVASEIESGFTGRLSSDGQQVRGTWRQMGLKVPLTLQLVPASSLAAPKTRLTPPYQEREVSYPNATTSSPLAGLLSLPPGTGPFPAVVLVSDAGAQDRDGTVGDYRPLGALADYLTRRGIAVLRFDDRGVGHSGSPGAPATVTDIVTDVQAALNYLRTLPEVDLTHLGIIGHGEGGNAALLAAAQPLPPAFIVTLAAHGLPGRDLVLQQQSTLLRSLGTELAQVEAAVKRQQAMLEIIRQTPDNVQAQLIVANMLRQSNTSMDPATAQASAAELTTPQYRHFLDFNPITKLPEVKCPVLLLNGTADLYVAADANLNALAKGLKGSSRVTSRKLAGLNHLFQPDPKEWPLVNGQPHEIFAPQAQEAIREWIIGLDKK